ncbi:MAG: hypothetical protein ACKOUM_11240, partial [Sphingopyxis sp.]
MTEDRQIVTEQVDGVAPPPRARVADAMAADGAPDGTTADASTETAGEKLERKRDYLTGFLAEKPATIASDAPGSDLQGAVIDALKEIFDPEIPVNIYD